MRDRATKCGSIMLRPIVIRKIGVFVAMIWACLALPLHAQELEHAAALERAYVLWQQGYILHSFGDYDSAADQFRRSIEAYPTAEGHTFLGWSLSHPLRPARGFFVGALLITHSRLDTWPSW